MNYKVTRNPSTGRAQCSWLSVVLIMFFTIQIAVANNVMPMPEIDGLGVACPDATVNYSTAFTTGNTYQWTLSGGGILSNSTAATATVDWTAAAGTGPYLLTVIETNGSGEMGMDEFEVRLQSTTLSCDDLVQVSLSQTPGGFSVVTPLMILTGIDANNDNYTINITNGANVSFGNAVSCANVGESLTAQVTSLCNGNSCWSEVVVEDKLSPTISCSTAPVEVLCDVDADNFPPPLTTDNCGIADVIMVDEVINSDDICGDGVYVVKSWIATDIHGNQSNACQQTLLLVSPNVVDFPSDVTWNCNDYANFPNITNPTNVTSFLPTTGSGFPQGISGVYCPFNYTSSDDTLTTCSGLKIVRTWTVLNWCTSEIVTTPDNEGEDNEQVIKVIDNTPPVVVALPQTLNAANEGSSLNQCKSTDFVEPPTVTDNCSDFEIRIFSPVGELEYVNGVDGAEGGNIPFPGLSLGVHIFTIEAIDNCGNVSSLNVPFTVADLTPPTPICDEITDANLDNNGEAEVFAETLDDGSHDNCGICDFEVKRMNQPDFAFSPSITFTCFDDNEMVVLRVYDCNGNTNDCMVEVNVNDKINPTCLAPPNVQIDCKEVPVESELADNDFMDNEFGEPSNNDNCGSFLNYFPVISSVDNCGEGTIVRTFQAIDFDGNISGLCQQIISVVPLHSWEIVFPPNYYGDCGEDYDAQDVEVLNAGCDLLATSYSDQLFAISDDSACFKIVRTYEVINWCTFDDEETAIVLGTEEDGLILFNTDFGNYGHYTYQQIIRITDDIAPTIEVEDEFEFCSIDEDCLSGIVEIIYSLDDNCTEDLEAFYEVDYFQNDTIDLTGTGLFEKNLPIGCHDVTFTVEDGCGNTAVKTVEVCIKDCKSPTAYCEDGVILEMNPTGSVTVWASDFDAGSFDNCEDDLIFSFSSDTTFTSETYECHEVEFFEEIVINVFVTDAAGNQGICETFVIIQDNQWTCEEDDPLIAGTISTADGLFLENSMVEVNGSMSTTQMTDLDGYFTFENMDNGGDYTITPSKNDLPLNGVSTFDLVKISRHILNITPLESPYKMIAADANNSQTITTLDLVELRKLVLYVNDNFNNNSSWRFVDADYNFPNPNNPWAENFPEVIDYNNLAENEMETNFIAIKIGDVNGNASTNGLLSADDRNFTGVLNLKTADLNLKAGQSYQVAVQSVDNQSLLGFQFSLNFDKNALQINSVNDDEMVKSEHFGFAKTAEGVLTNSWNASQATYLKASQNVFELEITALKDGRLSNLLNISSDYTSAEAYRTTDGSDVELLDIELQFTESIQNGFALYQNTPNPFREQTTIGFEIAEANTTILTVFDVTGKVVKTVVENLDAGYHQIVLQKADLPVTGVLFYQLESGDCTETRRMLVE